MVKFSPGYNVSLLGMHFEHRIVINNNFFQLSLTRNDDSVKINFVCPNSVILCFMFNDTSNLAIRSEQFMIVEVLLVLWKVYSI